MKNNNRYLKGQTLYHQLLGETIHEQAKNSLKKLPDIELLSLQFMYGEIYARTDLSLYQKEMATLASLITQQNEKALAFHLKGALHFGISAKDIMALIVQLIPVVGFPCATAAAIQLNELISDEPQSEESISVLVKVIGQPAQHLALFDCLNNIVCHSRQQRGCLYFELQQDAINKANFVIFEKWANQTLFSQHLEDETKKNMLEKLEIYLERPLEISWYINPILS